MENKRFRAWETAALAALCVALCAGTWAQARQNAISGDLVRLHVVAVSDEEHEQAVKLEVRDAVLEYLGGVLTGAENSREARTLIRENMEGILAAADSAAGGRSVSVSLGRENYPTRTYEGLTLPAGEYESLRIVLGAGEGHNWWCVVFPPVCLSAAEAERVQTVMSAEDYAIVSAGEPELRFRIVELWGELINLLHG